MILGRVARIHIISATAFVVMAAVLLTVANGKPTIYRNEEFGITLPIPKETLPCFEPKEHHDEGTTLLLGTSDAKICADPRRIEKSRYVAISASYNAVDETKRLQDFLTNECTSFPALIAGKTERCLFPPPGLKIPGKRSKAGKALRAGGWIDIIVVTQSGKPDPSFDPSVPSINYDITLHSRRQNLEGDVRILRTVLRTIRISPRT